MSELITDEKFTDGQQQIAASNMNGIISRAKVQPDIIANKPASATLDVADQVLVLKTDNTLARGRFDTFVNSTSSALPLADTTKNGMLRQVSGLTTDYVGGDNNCHQLVPTGTVWDFLGVIAPVGWLLAQGQSLLRTDYPNLFAVIGTTYGSVDATHFTLPDFQNRIPIGAGNVVGDLGTTGGAASVNLSVAQLPAHSHTIPASGNHSHSDSGHSHGYQATPQALVQAQGGSGAWAVQQQGATTGTGFANLSASGNIGPTGTNNAGSGVAVSVLNPYIAVNKIIRT